MSVNGEGDDVPDDPITLRERRTSLWVTVVCSVLAAALGSGVGGYFSYRASQSAIRDQANQAQTSFVLGQRQTLYLQATKTIGLVEASTTRAIYDALPYGAAITGDTAQIAPNAGPGQNPFAALNKSLPAFEAVEAQLVELGPSISVVGSKEAIAKFAELIKQYGQLDGYLYDARDTLGGLPNNLSARQVLSVKPDYDGANKVQAQAKALGLQFEAVARADLRIN